MTVPSVLSPAPAKASLKRTLVEDFDERASKRRRSPSPVDSWLSNVLSFPLPSLPFRRAQSAPAEFDTNPIPAAIYNFDWQRSPLSASEMSGALRGGSSVPSSTRSSTRSKIKTSDPRYRSILDNNHIFMDRSGMEAPETITNLIQTHLYKRRESPPLPREVLLSTVEKADEWAGSPENVVNRLLDTPMFPLDRRGLARGGNTQWPSAALPTNLEYSNNVALPEPDFHVGYSIGRRSEWSSREADVVDHPYALSYTQPGTGNRLPFLTLELKSEATGGTLWHAENQAAGSGTCCVKAMQWLLDQADPLQPSNMIDTVAFSAAATARDVVFYIHYYSEQQKAYFMSYINSYMTTDPRHIQECRNLVNNILDFGLGMRQGKLRKCLETLYPQIDTKWKKSRSASDIGQPPTPATSHTMASQLNNKLQRRE